jgi:hypothetical protein
MKIDKRRRKENKDTLRRVPNREGCKKNERGKNILMKVNKSSVAHFVHIIYWGKVALSFKIYRAQVISRIYVTAKKAEQYNHVRAFHLLHSHSAVVASDTVPFCNT